MLPAATLRSTPLAQHLAEASAAVVVLLVAIIVLVLMSIGTIRHVQSGRRPVVLRRGLIHRTPRGRFVLTVPVLDRVTEWPAAPVDVPLQVRSRSRDGAEVRVLAEISLDLSPPVIDDRYVEPISRAAEELSAIVEAAVLERDLDDLLDPVRGLASVVHGRELVCGAKIIAAEIAEVEVLLGDRLERRA